jgi:hypothetical protein
MLCFLFVHSKIFDMRKCCPLLILFYTLTSFLAHAAFNVAPQGSRAAGLGGIGVVNVDAFAAYNNQAALGFLTSPTAAIHYENKYFSEALNMSAGAFALPVPVAGVVAVDVCSFGYSQYRENRVGVALGKRLSERIAIGAQVSYNRVSAAGYGGTGAITAELGILAEPLENLWLGAHVYNFTHSKFFSQSYSERLPVFFKVGLGYKIAQQASLFAAAELDSKQNTQVKGGAEFTVANVLALRLGISCKPVEVYAGFGYTFRNFCIDMAFSRHETLGYSPQISLTYSFTKRKKGER